MSSYLTECNALNYMRGGIRNPCYYTYRKKYNRIPTCILKKLVSIIYQRSNPANTQFRAAYSKIVFQKFNSE